MSKCYYDFHIHTLLSPCGDDDMTPGNIVGMAILKGLDAIAITDHNTAANARACFECGKRAGLTVVPGMEIETSEDVHLVALFESPDGAEEMGEFVQKKLPYIKNRPDIFGHQFIMDADDNVVREVPKLLSTATSLSLKEAVDAIRTLGGVCIPAHIDKSSYSVISNLGFIPPELDFSVFELKFPDKAQEFMRKHSICGKVLHNSDAHFLWDISEKENFIELKSLLQAEIIDYLRQK